VAPEFYLRNLGTTVLGTALKEINGRPTGGTTT
jgi:hypothetical protein